MNGRWVAAVGFALALGASAYACGQSGGGSGGSPDGGSPDGRPASDGAVDAPGDGRRASDSPSADSPPPSDAPEGDGGCFSYTGALALQLTQAKAKIQHVVIIMQENRSYDHYFGTYDGGDGIPTNDAGQFTVCIPNSLTEDAGCTVPFHDTSFVNSGGPHYSNAAVVDINGGKMNGFIAEQTAGGACDGSADPECTPEGGVLHDAVGYHNRNEIPNYWSYADHFLLADKMFEPVASYSMPSHMFLVSAWSAICKQPGDAASCAAAIDPPSSKAEPEGTAEPYAWTDLTYILHKHGVAWKYYLAIGDETDCDAAAGTCSPTPSGGVNPFWNPLPAFQTVVNEDNELGNVVHYKEFLSDIQAGTLPPVSWIAPSKSISEHPNAAVDTGEKYVTSLVNAVMENAALWSSTVIFLAWDDWGGFYDHVPPVTVDTLGYGIRVPALTMSPYAIHSIDHQVLSFDAYIKFIEDVFADSERLDPTTDGRPDPRATVRECVLPGNLLNEFDFSQSPLPPLVLTPQ
jgi:phospholipase C